MIHFYQILIVNNKLHHSMMLLFGILPNCGFGIEFNLTKALAIFTIFYFVDAFINFGYSFFEKGQPTQLNFMPCQNQNKTIQFVLIAIFSILQ